MVSALASRSSGLGSSPDGGHCVMLQSKTSSQSLSTKVDKWVPTNFMLGKPCDGTAPHPTPPRATETGASRKRHFARMQTLPHLKKE